jgi:hypothetical protein
LKDWELIVNSLGNIKCCKRKPSGLASNIQIQKTGAEDLFYTETSARF